MEKAQKSRPKALYLMLYREMVCLSCPLNLLKQDSCSLSSHVGLIYADGIELNPITAIGVDWTSNIVNIR